jgi:hypothetical protein
MHGGHEHDHSNGGGAPFVTAPAGVGHNRPTDPRRPVQWQTPHRDDAPAVEEGRPRPETDLDMVEAAFVEGFLAASDATSFLRLAKVPFEGAAADGVKLALLRVEVDSVADVGSITPHLGGFSFRYDPLPARMISRRKRLRLVYFDGQGVRLLSLSEARSIPEGALPPDL